VVVVGGGWAGFSAADALATAEGEGVEVVLLDASPRGAGGLAGGWRTPAGRPVEAGVHGFWREYRNTFVAMEAIGLDLDAVLGPYTPSALFSRNGPVAVAPVLKPEEENGAGAAGALGGALAAALGIAAAAAAGGSGPAAGPERALAALAPLLPPPLDVALLAEFSPELGARLTPLDRASGAGLLGAWATCGERPRAEAMRPGLGETCSGNAPGAGPVTSWSPLLHVLPMGPGRDISAAAALSCFHVFALQARGAFDVRWCRGGITEKIFDPWAEKLLAGGRVALRAAVALHREARWRRASAGEAGAPAWCWRGARRWPATRWCWRWAAWPWPAARRPRRWRGPGGWRATGGSPAWPCGCGCGRAPWWAGCGAGATRARGCRGPRPSGWRRRRWRCAGRGWAGCPSWRRPASACRPAADAHEGGRGGGAGGAGGGLFRRTRWPTWRTHWRWVAGGAMGGRRGRMRAAIDAGGRWTWRVRARACRTTAAARWLTRAAGGPRVYARGRLGGPGGPRVLEHGEGGGDGPAGGRGGGRGPRGLRGGSRQLPGGVDAGAAGGAA
ncbi:unnamed protein product, partial [Heterosigma akashiwo]